MKLKLIIQISKLTGEEIRNGENRESPPKSAELEFLDQIIHTLHGFLLHR